MRPRFRTGLLAMWALCLAATARAQLPFYTDDPAVTPRGSWHFEFSNEFDLLQHQQYPNLRQNTANYKLNYGLPGRLELDMDAPYLAIVRDGAAMAHGAGDTNLGLKWNMRGESKESRLPAVGASFYVEFPTGDARRQLGSGLIDYWLNIILQKSVSESTRITGNLGFLFAGNTSTGVLGIETARGHVFTGGLSALRRLGPRLTLGVELYGGIPDRGGLARSQLQGMAGAQYTIRKGLALCFGLLGGKYIASPRIGAQFGIVVDFPATQRSAAGIRNR